MNDTRGTFWCVNLITVHRFTGVSFFMPKRRVYHAQKPISKNGVCIQKTLFAKDIKNRNNHEEKEKIAN